MAASSKNAVFLALAGNTFLTVIKCVAFFVSGSGAMFSETIHSLADTANQGLLYLGIRQSEREADAMFPYGYGAERYLYSLLSAIGIFVLGCGVTLYHGVHNLLDPPTLELSGLTFAVLGISLVVEGWVLLQARRAVWAVKGTASVWTYLRGTTDPTVAAVLLEDAVACIGVLVAAAGILLAYATGNVIFDSLGAIAIGGMLGIVAIWLGLKNRILLLGPSIPQSMRRDVLRFLEQHPAIRRVHSSRSRVVGADHFRFQAQLDFDGAFLGERLAQFVQHEVPDRTDAAACARFARMFGEKLIDELAAEVDRIEADLGRRFPELRHVDLEAD